MRRISPWLILSGLALALVLAPPSIFAAASPAATPAATPAPPAGPAASGPEDASNSDLENPPKATDDIAKKILQNFITVEGGAEALKKIVLLKATGNETPLAKNGSYLQFTLWVAPGYARYDTVEQLQYGKFREIHQVVEGKDGWSVDASANPPTLRDIAPPVLAGLTQLANFITDFVDYEAKGYRYQYAGKEKYGTTEALVLKFWPGSAPGVPEFYYFNPENFLLLRIRRQSAIGNQKTWINTYFTGYKNIEKIWLPSGWEYALSNAVVARDEITDVKFFPQPNSAIFAKPVGARSLVLTVPPTAAVPSPPAATPAASSTAGTTK